ncbi:MAG: carbon-nitrogen hydrolase family protein [Chloroflexi bacterium]|nr:carbon-nitrogen hydrolase family protein [Chloroflexota bacterium]
MSTVTVALLQMLAHGLDINQNMEKGDRFCRQAAAAGADIALFPEMWSIGYLPYSEEAGEFYDMYRSPELWADRREREQPIRAEDRERWRAHAIGADSQFVEHFRALARELGLAIAITYLERWDGAPRNTMSLIDRHGEIVLTYAKVHTCDFDVPEGECTPGDEFFVCDLDTAAGSVKVGAMICYDREFPESARVLMLKGAELILTPNACELEANRICQFRVRAYENMVGVAMANYAAPQQNGHSVAFHPMAFGKDGRSRDTLVVEAGEQEGVFLAPFDLEAIRDWRMHETWGNAFRRPHRYGVLTSHDVAAPFVRVDVEGTPYDRASR